MVDYFLDHHPIAFNQPRDIYKNCLYAVCRRTQHGRKGKLQKDEIISQNSQLGSENELDKLEVKP